VADAQVWAVIALLATAVFAIVIEMRRMNDRLTDRMTDGFMQLQRQCGELDGKFGELRGEFGELRGEFGELRGEFGQLRAEFTLLRSEVHAEVAGLRTDLQWHINRDHRPPA